MAEFRILSLDGGGSWALIQVKALIALYSKTGDGSDISGHDILKKFDLIVGNSGGTITMGGLIKNWTLDRVLAMFFDPDERGKIFVPSSFFSDPFSHLTQLAGIGPKYDTQAKLRGLRDVLGADGDRPVTDVPDMVAGKGYGGRPVHVVFCAFDHDRNREVFFRSDSNSLAGSRSAGTPVTIAQAIHASSNAPVNYFDAPASGPNHARYWDGAIGGYNNPVLAGVIEALANRTRYDTTRDDICALSIGTANTVLPFSKGDANEDHDLVVQRQNSSIPNDLKKIASSVLDDPPDAATFHAHLMLDCPLPGLGDALPGDSRIFRLNPLIQPILGTGGVPWALPTGVSRDLFVKMRDLAMDATVQGDVESIRDFCDLWLASDVPNQPIRANGATLAPEIGFARFIDAKGPCLRNFP